MSEDGSYVPQDQLDRVRINLENKITKLEKKVGKLMDEHKFLLEKKDE